MSALTCLLALLVAQEADTHAGDPTYIFRVKEGEEYVFYYGFADPDDFKKDLFTIVLDEPWRPAAELDLRIIGRNLVEWDQEDRPARERRVTKGWEDNDGVPIGPADDRRWVRKEDWDLAKRANELYAQAFPASSEEVAATVAAQASAPAPVSWRQWTPHILIVGAAAMSIALVVWLLILRPSRARPSS